MRYFSANFFWFSAMAGCLLLLIPGSVNADFLTNHEILQEFCSQRNLAENDHEVIYRTDLSLPLSGISGERVKIIDRDISTTYSVAVLSSGEIVDLAELKEKERQLHHEKYGRLEPALYEELQQMDGDDELQVVLWLTSETREFAPRIQAEQGQKDDLSLSEIQEIKHQAEIAGERYMNEIHQTFRDTVLNRYDLEVGYASNRAPFVFVTTTKSGVLALNGESAIDTIYRTTPAEAKSDNIDTQVLSHKTTMAWDVISGTPGSGVKFAHTEDSLVDWDNPYLTETESRVPGDTNIDNHATTCAGIAGSTDLTHRGHSYGCDLYSANGTTYDDDDMAAAMDWSVRADVCNNSWGPNVPPSTLDFHDRHCDYLVRHYYDTFTTVSGNHASYVSWMSFNDITVGGVNANDTETWADDTMYASSGYINPTGTDRELPNVVGDAVSIEATLADGPPWIGPFGSAQGTSYSTPAVGAQCVSMMNRDSVLVSWPEAVKAIVMATALHNIEGDTRLSDYDGAGMVDALAADKIANGLTNGGDQWGATTLNSGSFPYEVSFGVQEGELVRVVICWDSNPSGPPDYTTDPLEADLDLYLLDSSGSLVTSSISNDGSYEIVETTATETASWTMRVLAPTFSGSTEPMGYCYWTGNLAREPYNPTHRIYPPESYDNFSFEASPYWQAFAVKPNDTGANINLGLYNASRFSNPENIDEKAHSAYTTGLVDIVLVDENHATNSMYYTTVEPVSGSGNYKGELASSSADIQEGTFGPYSMTSNQIIRIWDLWLIQDEMKYVSVIPTSGTADLRLYIYDSDPLDSSTFYQDRGDFLYWADDGGAGEPEFLTPEITDANDWTGLVVYSDNRDYDTTSYYVYADTSPPDSGSLVINGDATYTNSRTVTLTLSSSDDETGIYQMKLGNIGGSWEPYEPYATTRVWELADVQGTTSAWAVFKNHAGIEADGQAGDTIILDTVWPTTICDSPTTQVGGNIPVDWNSSDATSGLDYTQLYYWHDAVGSWTAFGGQLTGSSGTVQFIPTHGEGDYWFGASAVDNAGNLNPVNEFGDTYTTYTNPTPTPTNTPTVTPTRTPTPTPTATPTPNPPTFTPTNTPTATPACINHGDVNFSGDLTAGDAQLTFYIVLGSVSPSFEEECAADCNGDGSVTAGDAQAIFLAVLGTGSCADPLITW